MAIRPDSATLRRRIGLALKHFRSEAGRTTEESSVELGCSRGKISQMEAGMYRLQFRDVRDLLKFYDAPRADLDRLVDAARRSGEPSWWQPYVGAVPDWFAFFLGSEGEADHEISYEQQVVPGMLQTQEYAEAITARGRFVAEYERELIVPLRTERQRRLTEDEPLRFTTLIEEEALRRPVGGPAIQRAQLTHLLDLTERPNINVQVLPMEIGAHGGLNGKFALLEFEDFTPGVYLEHQLGAHYSVDDRDLIATYTMIADELGAAALDEERSREFIQAIIEELS